MGFLSPWFLAGVAAVGLPIWLHLLRQFKRTPQPFSSLMFFEKRVQSSVKHRRLRYLVLLAMRIGLLVLLALAFANPFVNRTSELAGRRKLTIIAIDRSFSMRDGSRMAEAKAEAHRIVNGMRAPVLGQVVALDSHVENLTPPEVDRGALNAAIESIGADDSASSFGEFTRVLRLMDQTSAMRLEAHLISDMQQTSMPGFRDLQLGPHTALELHPVGRRDAPNWAVESVTTSAHVYDPAHTRLTATVTGWQTPPEARRVTLLLDGKAVASKDVTVPPNGRAQVQFLAFDVPYGSHRGQVRLEPHDGLPNDDAFLFAVERTDPGKVLFLYSSGRAREAFYYKAAMESASDTGLVVQPMAIEQAGNVDFSKYAFVVLGDTGDPGDRLARALCGYISRGGAALIVVGPTTTRFGRVPLSGDHVSEAWQTQGIGSVDTEDQALLGAGRFENVQFVRASRISPKANARVSAKLADGSPLLVEENMGEGRVLIFASTLDNSTNDFPLHASFLPFVVQTGHYLAGTEDRASSVTVGTPIALRRIRSEGTAADVIGPDGKHELRLNQATNAASFELTQDGFYDIQRADGKRLLVAAHADRRESDLKTVPDETLALWRNTGNAAAEAQSGTVEQQTRPWSLWRYFMALVLAAALIESVFASRYLKEGRQTA